MELTEEKAKSWLYDKYLRFIVALVENTEKSTLIKAVPHPLAFVTKMELQSINKKNDLNYIVRRMDENLQYIKKNFNQVYLDFEEENFDAISAARHLIAYGLTDYYIMRVK